MAGLDPRGGFVLMRTVVRSPAASADRGKLAFEDTRSTSPLRSEEVAVNWRAFTDVTFASHSVCRTGRVAVRDIGTDNV